MFLTMVHAIEQIAVNSSRAASGLEAIKKLVPLLTPPIGVNKVAELAGVKSLKTVYRWKEEGLLKPLSENKPLLFDQQVVADFVRRNRKGGK